ncbi:MAG: hypothetical protein IPM51_12980 [Sphingobacteriaceae bacterium]|nr:hypothetical protein [Sphingobacteriaceae bacterium]
MVQLLNKYLIVLGLLFTTGYFAQIDLDGNNSRDYKNKKQFEKFYKKKNLVGNWQINQFKKGALVVKLKTNSTLIDQLEKAGKTELAEEKRVENFIYNRMVMEAFKDKFTFCKVYFIFSHFTDSLLNGARKGIFLDTNLSVNQTIVMNEIFYLIGERDRIYNSSIGFVPEDSARFVKENGNPSGYDVLAVIKNKYGHQLKKPFPYVCGYGIKNSGAISHTFVKEIPVYYYRDSLFKYRILIDKTQLADYKASEKKVFKRAPAGAQTYIIKKEFAFEVLASGVERYNDEVSSYYQASPPIPEDRMPENIKVYLY